MGRLQRENGSWVEEEGEKKRLIPNHFVQLFRTSADDDGLHTQQLLDAVHPSVTSMMNEHLTKEFTHEEIKAALDSIGDLKAPGPDGTPAAFFKNFWDVVGQQLTKEVLGVLQGGRLPEGWNDTIISLIPKVEKPEKVTDLRPISLCNVVYIVVSKVLASRFFFPKHALARASFRLRSFLTEPLPGTVPGRIVCHIYISYQQPERFPGQSLPKRTGPKDGFG